MKNYRKKGRHHIKTSGLFLFMTGILTAWLAFNPSGLAFDKLSNYLFLDSNKAELSKPLSKPEHIQTKEPAKEQSDKKKPQGLFSIKRELIKKLWEDLQPYPFDSQKKNADKNTGERKKQQNKQKVENNKTVFSDRLATKNPGHKEENKQRAYSEKSRFDDDTAERLSFSKRKSRIKESASTTQKRNPCTVELKIEGVIGAVVLDIIDRAIHTVNEKNCSALLLLINTPGGLLFTTRKIVDRILNTDFPVLCLIHPAGAHAGSAGAIIMQACHVNGGIEATNIGAATPIAGGGRAISKDLRKKLINDTVSWLDSLTQLRKRSQKFGREIVTEAKALSAKEAKKEGGIDFVGKTKRDFLQFAEGRKVIVRDGKQNIVQVGEIMPLPLGFRYQLVSLILAPEIIYILFTGSLFLLYYEITHPGLGAPGVLGAIGLVISFVGMHKLDFSWAGLILLLLSVILCLAELFISGFGIFGAGAVVSFLLGSFLLFDPAKTGGVDIPVSLIFSITGLFALFMGTVTYLALSTFKRKKPKIIDDFMDPSAPPAEVVHVNEDSSSGLLFVNGENWRFECQETVKKGDKVKVLSCSHLILKVKPFTENKF